MNKKLNVTQIHHYLLYKYAEPPETFYQDVFALEQGHILSYKEQKWEKTAFPIKSITANAAEPDSKMVEKRLTQSLLQQINANVPIGLLLSGGVDSTLLLALAQKEGYNIPTFSIINSKADSSFGTQDFHYAKLAASTYASEHTEFVQVRLVVESGSKDLEHRQQR